MTVLIAIIDVISTAGHIPTVTDTLAPARMLGPSRVSLPCALGMPRALRSRPRRGAVARIAFSVRSDAEPATLFVHAGVSCFRSRTRGLAQHDV
jgi:hypothetical protein